MKKQRVFLKGKKKKKGYLSESSLVELAGLQALKLFSHLLILHHQIVHLILECVHRRRELAHVWVEFEDQLPLETESFVDVALDIALV